MNQNTSLYDVVVVGDALSGAATATLLLRSNPGLNLLIVEKSTRFTRRVGEATVEVSAFFMGRILGMTQYLNESHLVNQLDRATFDEEVLRRRLGSAGNPPIIQVASLASLNVGCAWIVASILPLDVALVIPA